MKKRILTAMCFFAVIVFVSVLKINAASGIDYAYSVKGGKVTNADELVMAFTDANGNAHAEKIDEYTVKIKNNVILTAPIHITAGSYTLTGGGSTVYRGFYGGPLVMLDGSEDAEAPSLTLETDIGSEEWNEANFRLCIDGNSENYPDSEYGLIMVRGNAKLSVNGRVVLKNSSTVSVGGAIFAEIDVREGVEKSPLSPEVTVNNARIVNCSAMSAGGGIAFSGYFEGVNGGKLTVSNTVMTGNKSHNVDKVGMGGAIYTYGGEAEISNMTISDNSADMGGAIYTGSVTKLTMLTIKNNKSEVAGGALYGASDEYVRCDISLKDIVMTENESSGDGGAVYSRGIMVTDNLVISQNDAAGNGGGIFSSGRVELNDGSVMNNKSGKSGGGIYCKGLDSVLILKSPSISSNSATLCASVYSEGLFEFHSGTIENGKGDFPSILIKGEIVLKGKVSVVKDEIGLCIGEKNGKSYYPYIKIEPSSGFYGDVTVAFCREKTDKDGNVNSYKNATENKLLVCFGDESAMLETLENITVKSRGLLSYKVGNTGLTSVRLVFLPVFVWVIILVAVCGAVAFIFRKKIVLIFKKK